VGPLTFSALQTVSVGRYLGARPLIQSDDSHQNCTTEEKSAKPDAHFTITSRNICNLLIHRQDVCDCEDNVQVLQECDLLEHRQSTVNEALNQGPWQRHYGNVVDISHEEGKRRGRRVATMVNAAQDNAIHMQTDEEDYKFLMDSGRWVEITLPTSEKGHFFTIANFYGIAGASQSQKSHEYKENERLAAAAGRRAASMPKHPYFLFGDFNVNIQHSKVLSALIEQQLIFDVGAEWTKQGEQPQNTFSREGISPGMTGSGKTRIDYVFANEIAIRIIKNFEYLFDQTHGYDHLPIRITLDIEAFMQILTVLGKPNPVNINAYDPKIHTPEIKAEIWSCIWQDKELRFEDAIAAKNVDKVHTIWCEALEEFLHTLLPTEQNRHKDVKYSRGHLQSLKEESLTNKLDVRIQTLTMHLDRQLGKAINKTRQLTAQFRGWMKRGDTVEHAMQFWESDANHGALWSDVTKYAEDKLDPLAAEARQENAESDNPWIQQPSYQQLQKANEILTDKANGRYMTRV